ncbi:ABC transporter permease [Aeromonas enteropelogenes]|uniref:ABC transporter permease n=1 Tax=Aeromonas enteropelogenes TaxID=29489 RepID=UPI003B9E2235
MQLLRLSLEFSRRELLTKYKGSFLGPLWVVLSPLLLLALYSAVFQYVFKARWDIDGLEFNYTVALFCGLTPYFFMTEMIGKSSDLINNNASLIKKVVFNRLSIPLSATISALFILIINMTLVLFYRIYDAGTIKFIWLSIYLYILPLFLIGLAIATLFSSLGAYIKDLGSVANFINPVLMFVSPVFFDAKKVSPIFESVIKFNPLSPIISGIRNILLESYIDFSSIMLISFFSLLACAVGVYLFKALEEDFADLT